MAEKGIIVFPFLCYLKKKKKRSAVRQGLKNSTTIWWEAKLHSSERTNDGKKGSKST